MFKTIKFLLAAVLFATVLSLPARAAVLVTDDVGNLLGANDVYVGGSLFDVTFNNGTCPALWPGCGDVFSPLFTFQTDADAMDAANALIMEVFSANDVFDTDPTRANGCDDPTACYIITPYALDGDMETVFAYNALNHADNSLDISLFAGIGTYTPTNPDATYAIWSAASTSTPVPEPETVWLFLPAALGLIASRGRRNRRRP